MASGLACFQRRAVAVALVAVGILAAPGAARAQAVAAEPPGSVSPPAAADELGTAAPRRVTSERDTQTVGLVWPLPAPHRIVKPFLAPATRYSAGHRGVDIAAAPGAPVTAPAAGSISFAGTVVDRPVVTIDAGDGVLVSIEPVTAILPLHSTIGARQIFGTVASGGHCGERCIHLGVRVNGAYVSPLLFLGGVPRAILLPMQ